MTYRWRETKHGCEEIVLGVWEMMYNQGHCIWALYGYCGQCMQQRCAYTVGRMMPCNECCGACVCGLQQL